MKKIKDCQKKLNIKVSVIENSHLSNFCIFDKRKICTKCVEKVPPYTYRPYDLVDEIKMGYGYKLIRGFNLLAETRNDK